jgi:hypothetical protein
LGHHIDDMGSDRERLPTVLQPMHHLPIALLPYAADAAVVLAAASRAGARPTPSILVDPGVEDVAQAVRRERAEFVVARCEGIDASIQTAFVLSQAGARVVPALGIRGPAKAPSLDVATIALLTEDRLRDLNVAVPVLEDGPRAALWDSLRTVRVEECHHLVEVDGRPAPDAAGAPIASTPSVLAIGATGVLVGRMAAANRRWREDA